MTLDPTVVVAVIGALATGITAAARMVYLDLRRDRDFWRDTALKALGHTDKALEVAVNRGGGDA